jgi:hypothetical protein
LEEGTEGKDKFLKKLKDSIKVPILTKMYIGSGDNSKNVMIKLNPYNVH